MKQLCFITVILFFTMTACLNSFAAALLENEVQSSSETKVQVLPEPEEQVLPDPEEQVMPESEEQVLPDPEQVVPESVEQVLPESEQASTDREEHVSPESEMQAVSSESQSENQKAKRDLINELQEIITENQQYEEFLQELDSTLKELRTKTADRLKKRPDTDDSQADATSTLKPKGLGKWWLRNALTYDPMPSELLYHLETSYSFSRMTGNMTVDKHIIKTWLITRYNRFTSYLNYNFDKRNSGRAADYPEGNKMVEENFEIRNSTKHLITEELRCAILKQLFAAVGFIYEEDDFVSLDKRITGYLGFGARPIQNDHFTLKFFAALGHEEKDYTKDYHELYQELALYFTKEELKIYLPDYDTDTIKSDIFYCDLSFNWSITDNIAINEVFITFIDTDDSDKYRWTLDLGLEYQFTEHFSLMLNYNECFDKAMNPLMGRKRDISKDICIKVVF